MRYLGLLIMASACTGAGFLAAESWRERLEILKLLRQMAYHLKGRILYANETLPEALFEVGERFSKDRTGMCLEPGRLFFIFADCFKNMIYIIMVAYSFNFHIGHTAGNKTAGIELVAM